MALLDEQIRVAFEHQMVVVPPTVDFDVKCMPDIGVIIASWGVHYALEFSVSTHFLLELLQHASRLPKMPMKQPPQIGLDGLWRAYDQARSQGSADWVRMLFADARMSTEEKIARLVMVADKTQDSLLTEFLRRPFPLPTPIAKFRPEGPLTRWVNFSVDTTLLFFILHELAHAIRMDDRYDSKSIEIFQFLRKEGVVGGRDRSVAEEHYADIFAIASVNEQHQRSLLECANFFFHLYHIRFWLSGGTRGEYPSPGERWNILSRYFGADTMKASFGEMDDYLGAFTSPLYGIDASIELQMSMFVACIEKMTTLLLNDA